MRAFIIASLFKKGCRVATTPSDENTNTGSRRSSRVFRSISMQARSANPSWGERLLPFVFIVMEVCWVDAIFISAASRHFFGLSEPLIALWAPFVLMSGTVWLSNYLEYDNEQASPRTTVSK